MLKKCQTYITIDALNYINSYYGVFFNNNNKAGSDIMMYLFNGSQVRIHFV